MKQNLFSQTIYNILIRIFSLTVPIFLLLSCSDSEGGTEGNLHSGKEANLHIKFDPSVFGSGNPDEAINQLRLIAFQMDGTTVTVVRNMLIVNASGNLSQHQINLSLPAGRHIMYFIANAENKAGQPQISSTLANITTEEELKQVMLTYSIGESFSPLEPPLLMLTKKDITISGDYTLDLQMQRTCAKLSYTIRFDNADVATKADLKSKKFEIRSLQIKQLAAKQNLAEPTLISTQAFKDAKALEMSAQTNPDFNSNAWTISGVAYIPECFYTEQDEVTYLEVKGGIIGSTLSSTYKIEIKGRTNDSSEKITLRGTEYKVNVQIKSQRELDGMDINLDVKEWIPQSVNVSAGEYNLWISKNVLNIKSLVNDEFTYTTNADKVRFELEDANNCAFQIEEGSTAQNGKVVLKSADNAQQIVSSTHLKVILSNADNKDVLTKTIQVNFDFEPFIKIKNRTLFVDWEIESPDAQQAGKVTKTIFYETNLSYQDIAIVNSNAPVTYQIAKGDKGQILVTVPLENESKEYSFDLQGTSSGGQQIRETVTIKVKPNLGDKYRIYFRVINSNVFGSFSPEHKWEQCYLDLYNQTSAYTVRFRGDWPGSQMMKTMDGWFVTDVDKNSVPKIVSGDAIAGSKAKIEPGMTLVMFSKENAPLSIYRYPGSNEPGIPLFNFDDDEGWFVFDMAAFSGTLSFYDDKPEIIDRNYTVYFKASGGSWSSNKPRLYTYTPNILVEPNGNFGNTVMQEVIGQPNWYTGTTTIKAVAESNTAQQIYYVIHDATNNNSESNRYPLHGVNKLLFDGRNEDVGWFDFDADKKWYSGSPFTRSKKK